MRDESTPIPYGFCHCGCGQRTNLAKRTVPEKGHFAGQPYRFVPGHHKRKSLPLAPETVLTCACGCGSPIAISPQASSQSRFVQGHNGTNATIPKRYRVNEAGCWIWQGSTVNGYGTISRRGRHVLVHKALWEEKFGAVPDGLELDHAVCQNRSCVNPDHLEAVTHTENIRRARTTKLTLDDAREIRELAGTLSYAKIASKFGISRGYAWAIAHHKWWRED